MKLSATELRILSYIEMRANLPVTAVAQALSMRVSRVHYYLSRLRSRGIVLQRRAYVDSTRLGYSPYVSYFSSALHQPKDRERLLRVISQDPRVTWLAEIGGSWQYACSVAVRHAREVVDFHDQVSKKVGAHLIERTLSQRLRVVTFGRQRFGPSPGAQIILQQGEPLRDGGAHTEHSLDEVGRRVLRAVAQLDFASYRELAKQQKLPLSTFLRRLKELEQQRVIQGYYYILDPQALGLQEYRILISLQRNEKALRENLLRWALRCRQARKYLECLGSWDLELELEVESSSELSQVTSELYAAFQNEIRSVQTIPLLRHRTCAAWRL